MLLKDSSVYDRGRSMKTGTFVCTLALSATLLAPCDAGETLQRYEFRQIEMGAPFRITLYAADEAAANKAAEAAFERIDALEDIMSDYDPDSELMRLCRKSEPGEAVAVSDDLLHVLVRAQKLSKKTDGAFDVTVGPIVRLWRIARRKKELPPQQALQAALGKVGYQNVKLDRRAGTVELKKQGMRLDLGGIAKGYAGDEALEVLEKHDLPRALVDAGGDIVAGDPPPGKKGWRIGIASPVKPDEPPERFLQLQNAAVATSGDAYRFIEIDGTRYSHIVNPKTGVGLTVRRSVTVVAPKGISADAMASALSVLGPRRGIELVEQCKHTAALIAQQEDGRLRVVESREFAGWEISGSD